MKDFIARHDPRQKRQLLPTYLKIRVLQNPSRLVRAAWWNLQLYFIKSLFSRLRRENGNITKYNCGSVTNF